MSTNGGANMVVSGQTSPVQQQAMANQIAYNIQNNIPYALHTTPGDVASSTIANAIMSQAQTLAKSPAISAPTIGTQVGASTTGSNPANDSYDFYGSNGGSMQTSEDTSYNPITGQAGNSDPAAVTLPGETSWLQAHMANYGLVILGALLMLGALLISQRGNIEAVVETAAKTAVAA